MKITFSNKKAEHKPTKETAGKFFGKIGSQDRIQFKTGNFTLETFEKIIGNGHVIGYQCKDEDCMNRKKGYIGTQYIIVDVDAVDYDMEDMLSMVKHTPTIIHTTYSNLTPSKNNKYCFHLIYCLNEVIYGEENFYKAFKYFSEDYDELVDKNAKDCHRITYTSHHTLNNYEYRNTGVIYDVKNILVDEEECFDDYDNFFSVSKNYSSTYNISSTNKEDGEKNDTLLNTYSVDEGFFENYMSLPYSEFLAMYSLLYKVQYETTFEIDETKSYVDLSDTKYYKVSPKYKWNNDTKKNERLIVRDGNRHRQLFKDAIQFKYINPDITLEQLIISLTDDFYKFYDKTNCRIDKRTILDLAKEVYNGDYKGITTKKSHAVNKGYFQDKTFIIDGNEVSGENLTKQQRNGISRKDMKDEELLSCYDFSLSLEENHKYIKTIYPHKKSRLIETLERNGLDYFSSKDEYKEIIINLHLNNPTLSLRKLVGLCREKGIKVSFKTIDRILKEYNK